MQVHVRMEQPVIPDDGTFPYWTTVCGKTINFEPMGITSNDADVTCPRCMPATKRSKRAKK